MSQQQQRSAKEKYGSRSNWQGEKRNRMAGDKVVTALPYEKPISNEDQQPINNIQPQQQPINNTQPQQQQPINNTQPKQETQDRSEQGWSNYVDTPMSQMSMNESYQDTPESTIEFATRHSAINRATQDAHDFADHAKIANQNISQMGTSLADLDMRTRRSAQVSRDRSTIANSHLYGDQFAAKPPTWNSSIGNQEEVEKPDFGEIYDGFKDDVDDVF